ncbi:MAG: 16S rRNA (guanine(527)-N(7))-methyltransferase RsmG [Betaproteobacteria bacterium]|nr:16S rRNA (guanine(527)-N(7))-methyltransferase RsmG [Betaproteobacteria bacterium]
MVASQAARDRGRAPGQIAAACTAAGYPLLPSQAEALGRYLELLNRWNRVHSLTAIDSLDEQLTKHILDSLAAWRKALSACGGLAGGLVADVGSGMGAPGVIWAAVMPESRFSLIERQQKKAAFLRHVIGQLGWADRVEVIESDVRDLWGKLRADLITSRAFADVEAFFSLTAGISGPGTWWAAMAGRQVKKVSEHLLIKMGKQSIELETYPALRLEVPGLFAERHLVLARRKK